MFHISEKISIKEKNARNQVSNFFFHPLVFSFTIFFFLLSHVEVQLMQYPSVTICVEFTFKKYIDEKIYSSNFSLKDTEALIKENFWKKNETFYFVNQKSNTREDFPCMTTSESSDPGRPCSFPFQIDLSGVDTIDKDDKIDNTKILRQTCTNYTNPEPWCYTKLDMNNLTLRSKFLLYVIDCFL